MTFLDKNIKALEQINPDAAEWIKGAVIGDDFEILNTISGHPNLRFNLHGEKILAYDKPNPLKAIKEGFGDREFFKEDMTILVGFGLGYTVRFIADRMEDGHVILVIEERPDILKIAFELGDFSELINSKGMLFTLPNENKISELIKAASYKMYAGSIQVEVEPYAKDLSKGYASLLPLHTRQ